MNAISAWTTLAVSGGGGWVGVKRLLLAFCLAFRAKFSRKKATRSREIEYLAGHGKQCQLMLIIQCVISGKIKAVFV